MRETSAILSFVSSPTNHQQMALDNYLVAPAAIKATPPAVVKNICSNRVRGLDKIVDALDALQRGEFLTTRQAATICEVSDQTIINWMTIRFLSVGRSPKSAPPGLLARLGSSITSSSTAADGLRALRPRTC
jgi:hypothetical protein